MFWLLPTLLTGCSGPDPEPVVTDPPRGLEPLDPVDHLVRASMAVRGVRPTIEEIDAVTADPSVLPAVVRGWLEGPEFATTVRDMWAEILLIRNDTFNQLPALGLMRDYELEEIYQGTVEEPLRLVEHVITNDRPLTEILTADYVLVDDITATIYGVPYDYTTGGWQVTEWDDDRPKAGLLSSAQVWRRWESDGSNFNRGRANMIAGRLLCEEFESRDIAVIGGIDVADEEEVANAVVQVPECVACHQSMDPLAGYFWGFKKLIHRNYVADSITGGCEFNWANGNEPEFGASYLPEDYCYPIQQYNPVDEDDWAIWALRPPSYFGDPVKDLVDVGQAIAADPRFSACMARQFFGYLAQVDPEAVPFEVTAELQGALIASEFDAKVLVEAVVLHPQFSAIRELGPPSPSAEPSIVGLRTIRPEQHARAVEDLTGYRWWSNADNADCDNPNDSEVKRFGSLCWGDVDLSDSDVFGFRAMAGGVDGKVVLRPTRTVTPTKTLVMSKLASDAASSVVTEDFLVPAGQRRLLGLVEPTTTDDATVRAQIAWLHKRVLGESVDAQSEVVDASLALFDLGRTSRGTVEGGWTVLISALLQDPRMVFF